MAETIKKVVADRAPTAKMLTIMEFMINEGAEGVYFAADVADGTGLSAKSVSPVLTAMAKRKYVTKGEGQREAILKNGKEVKTYKTYTLTEVGAAALAAAAE